MPRTLPYTVVSQLCRARAEAVFFTSPPSRVEIRKVYKLSKCQGCQASGFIDEVAHYSALPRVMDNGAAPVEPQPVRPSSLILS